MGSSLRAASTDNQPRQAPSVPGGDHQPLHVDVVPLLPELYDVEELMLGREVIVPYEVIRP
jgi:hypothetical protein